MKAITPDNVQLIPVRTPAFGLPQNLPELPDAVYTSRLRRVRAIMEKAGLDFLAIYADREHFGNFRYLVGFEPRFEEGLLVIGVKDPSYVLLGNECYPMHSTAKMPVEPILCQAMSLPSQPMDQFTSMRDLLVKAGMKKGARVGLAGWKLFTPAHGQEYKKMFCVPAFIANAIVDLAGVDFVINATSLFIDPEDGLRVCNEADQIAVYEFGSAYASQGLLNLWENIKPGMSELELADYLVSRGLPQSCHIITAAGPNTRRGLVSPTSYRVKAGDPLTASMGLEGGLSCRGGYIVNTESELAGDLRNYVRNVVKPYYAAVASWYETVGIGVAGGELYATVQAIIPKEKYGWILNPGHLIATEEWLCSPVRPGSKTPIRSGMIVQMDIIPAGDHVSPNVEDGVLIADSELRGKLRERYPDVHARMLERREFMRDSLGIHLREETLPMSNLAGLYRPLALNRELALAVKR